MAEEKNFICTACPQGCTLDVTMEGDEVVHIAGNRCNKGIAYAHEEATDPRRMISSTVRIKNGFHTLLPVYTRGTISKHMIPDVLAELRKVELTAPIKAQTVVIPNVLGTGVDIIASRDMPVKG